MPFSMPQSVRSALTLLVLTVLLVAALAWGWSAATAPLPKAAPQAPCTPTPVAKGENVRADQVLVSVLNAGTREGLASRTMQLLVDAGFAEGESGNAPGGTAVPYAQVWSADPASPAAVLVASRLGPDVEIVQREATAPGIVVVVGDDFSELAKGKRRVKARTDTEICSPPKA